MALEYADYIEKLREESCDLENNYIFICYASDDWEVVFPDVLKFRELGYNIWIDKCQIGDVKDHYTEYTIPAIRSGSCKLVVFYQSQNSILSKPVLEELQCAKNDEITLQNHKVFDVQGRLTPVPIQTIAVDENSSPNGISSLISSLKEKADPDEANRIDTFTKLMYPNGFSGKNYTPYKGYKKRFSTEEQYYKFICCGVEYEKRYTWEKCKKTQLSADLSDLEKLAQVLQISKSYRSNTQNDNNAEDDRTGTLELDDGIYVGQIRNSEPHGYGTLTFSSGHKYEGSFKNGTFHGEGTFTSADGTKITGVFDNGILEGTTKIIYENKDQFDGQCKNNKREGRGTYTFANGDTISGDYINDELNCKDAKVDCTNGNHYRGPFKDGEKHGTGIEWRDDNPDIKYEVEYKNGVIVCSDYYDPKEKAKISILFKDGIQDTVEYQYDDGTIKQLLFNDNEEIEQITKQKNGENSVTQISYRDNGEIEQIKEDKNGNTRIIKNLSPKAKNLLIKIPFAINLISALIPLILRICGCGDQTILDISVCIMAASLVASLVCFWILSSKDFESKVNHSFIPFLFAAVLLGYIILALLAGPRLWLAMLVMFIYPFVGSIVFMALIFKFFAKKNYKKHWILYCCAAVISYVLFFFVIGNSFKDLNLISFSLHKGNIVTLGSFDLDGDPSNGSEPITWTVISADNHRAVLLCDVCVAARPYTESTDNTWTDSSIREWLNNDFYNEAFSHNEMMVIVAGEITTDIWDSDRRTVVSSEVTTDRVILPDSSMIGPDSRKYADDFEVSYAALEDYLTNTVYEPDQLIFWIREPVGDEYNVAVRFLRSTPEYNHIEHGGYALVRPVIIISQHSYSEYLPLIAPQAD